MKQVEQIAKVLRNVQADRLGVVFIGNGPRLIGTIAHTESIENVKRQVDPMLLALRLSATFISRAQLQNGRIFVAAHG